MLIMVKAGLNSNIENSTKNLKFQWFSLEFLRRRQFCSALRRNQRNGGGSGGSSSSEHRLFIQRHDDWSRPSSSSCSGISSSTSCSEISWSWLVWGTVFSTWVRACCLQTIIKTCFMKRSIFSFLFRQIQIQC